MKQIDKKTERKLLWLFVPAAVVIVMFILDVFLNLNMNCLEWFKPVLIGTVSIGFVGFFIATIKQKCWSQFAVLLAIYIFMLLNMSNVFVDLLAGK